MLDAWLDSAGNRLRLRATRVEDEVQLAHRLVRESTGGAEEPDKKEISRVMAGLGRKGGKIGGKGRAESLDQKRRSQIASQAAKKRWGNLKRV